MSSDSLEGVYSFVERAYVRMQAGDLLTRCLEDGSIAPIQQMVESLVVGGVANMNALRETLSEAGRRKRQVQEDLDQILSGLSSSLISYGLRLDDQRLGLLSNEQPQIALLDLLRQQGIHDQATQVACLQLLKETRLILESLAVRLRLLDEIEAYLQDWLWGIAYQFNRRDANLH